MSAPVAWLVQSREKFRTQAEAEARKAQLLRNDDDTAVCITPVYPKQQHPVLLDGDFCRDWRLKP